MQASAVSLLFDLNEKSRYLLTLIDSPGHVDFAGQVQTATRISDGGVLVVDVIEGVCAQTLGVLRLAHASNLPLTLFINKLDRLFLELKLEPREAARILFRLVDQINAVDAMVRGVETGRFDPRTGNVVFGSATEAWGLSLPEYADKIKDKINEPDLVDALWDESCVFKGGRLVRGESGTCCLASLLLAQINTIYSASEEKLKTIGDKFKVNGKNARSLLASWLPLSRCIFQAIIEHLPGPTYSERSCLALVSKSIKTDRGEMCMVRVYDGCIRPGQRLFLLQPRYEPGSDLFNEFEVEALYLLMGRGETIPLEEAHVGNVIGLQSQDLIHHLYKCGTIAHSLDQVSLIKQDACIKPLVKVAVEPRRLGDWSKLREGLTKLCRSDPIAELEEGPGGELVLGAVGELHLEMLLRDLQIEPRFGACAVQTSPPKIPFRETYLHSTSYQGSKTPWSNCFKLIEDPHKLSGNAQDKLIETLEDCHLYVKKDLSDSLLHALRMSFRMAMQSGPLSGEPISGVNLLFDPPISLLEDTLINSSLQSELRDAIHEVLLCHAPRLMLATYSCSIQTTTSSLGRVYSCLSRRHSRIITESYDPDTSFHTIEARMPVAEAMGFSEELRSKTSGLALPQLIFDGFECLDEPIEKFDEEGRIRRSWRYLQELRQRRGMNPLE